MLSDGAARYACISVGTPVVSASPAGRGREKSSDRNSARVGESSITALYIRCSSMFWRRMSVMIAIRGFSATM